MANWFEDLTKTMADEQVPRRQAMRRIAGSVTGVALASWLPGQVLAKNIPWKKQCPFGGSNCDAVNCTGNPNTNCFCFTDVSTGTGACGCNQFCSQLPLCTSDSGCAKGTFCSVNNGCNSCSPTQGVCIAKCKGKHKNCQLGSGHGLTATGRV